MNVYRQAEVPLLVCAVVVGNAFPVVEMPRAPAPLDGAPADAPTGGHLGRAIVGKAHAHLAVVAGQAANVHRALVRQVEEEVARGRRLGEGGEAAADRV